MTATTWVGGWDTSFTADISGKLLYLTYGFGNTWDGRVADDNSIVVFVDSLNNWAAYQTRRRVYSRINTGYASFIEPGVTDVYAESTTGVDFSDIVKLGFFYARTDGAGTATLTAYLGSIYEVSGPEIFVGGGEAWPVNALVERVFLEGQLEQSAATTKYTFAYSKQGSGQGVARLPIQYGDGTTPTYVKKTAQSLETPSSAETDWKFEPNTVDITFYASSQCVFDCSSAIFVSSNRQNFTIHPSSAVTADGAVFTFNGCSVIGFDVTWKTGIECEGVSFSNCGPIQAKGADFTNCTIVDTQASASEAAIAFDTSGATVQDCTIDLTGTSAGYHIELGASVTAITLNGVTLTGTPGTDKIYSALASGTLTITVDGTGSSLVAGDVTFVGGSTATAEIVSPTVTLTVNNLIAGSTVKAFTSGTQTEVWSVSSSGTSEVWTTAGGTVDITILKDGYLPYRETGRVFSGVSQTLGMQQVLSRAWITPSGLTFGPNFTADTTNKHLKANVATTVQNLYCALLSAYRTEASLANKAFPMTENGPNSFSLIDGWETRGYVTAGTGTNNTTLENFSRDGLRYVNASGNVTAVWAALLSVGVPDNTFAVRFQQEDGLSTQTARATADGNINQLIQIISDPNGDGSYVDGYDRSGWLVLKVQREGYDQAEAIAAGAGSIYGTLEDQLFVVGLTPSANGIAAGVADATVTITFEPTPVEWPAASGKYFSTTIKDTTDTHSGLEIMQAVRARDDFNLHDMVRPNGTAFKTVNGNFYGDAYLTPAGVRVVKADGTTPHADFNVFASDDPSITYVPPVTANISITNLPVAGNLIRLQIYNMSTDTIIYSDDPGSATYTDSYIDGVGITAGNTLRVRFVELNAGTSFKFFNVLVEATADGFNVDANNYLETDAVYGTNGVDGSSLTVTSKFSADFSLTDPQINLATVSNFIGAELYAYWRYLLTDATGIGVFWGGMTANDVGNYRINDSVVDMYLDNETPASKRQTDASRIYRNDGTYPVIDPTTSGYGIDLNWQNVVYVVSTGGSALTPTESAQLMALPSATANATATLAAAQVTPINANMVETVGTALQGDGTEGNKFRSVLVP